MSSKLIAVAAALEAAVGLALIIDPALVSSLLLGADLSTVGKAVARVGGFALLGLGLSCWPGPNIAPGTGPARGLMAYNALAAIFFVYLGARAELVGPLLWPAAALHAILAILLAWLFAKAITASS